MEFDRYTVVLLILRDEAPHLTDADADALQDAHMAHLADLHEAGHLLAAGPLLGSPDRKFRGLSILNVDPERALELKAADPAVRAGRFALEIFPWMVPKGAVSFAPARFPRSMSEAGGD
jgi:uncharacterized protein